jgi:uncharacterized protein (DUF2267 family)
MIKRVQRYSGFSDSESKDALDCTVETLAVHLTEGERKHFASQLPSELKDRALSVFATRITAKEDILEQVARLQNVTIDHAKNQLLSSWHAIKDAISDGEIQDVRAQLPKNTKSLLF